jgi:hypothetical protein
MARNTLENFTEHVNQITMTHFLYASEANQLRNAFASAASNGERQQAERDIHSSQDCLIFFQDEPISAVVNIHDRTRRPSHRMLNDNRVDEKLTTSVLQVSRFQGEWNTRKTPLPVDCYAVTVSSYHMKAMNCNYTNVAIKSFQTAASATQHSSQFATDERSLNDA